MRAPEYEGPPSTDEVVAVIRKSRSEFLRKGDRNIISRLLTHRNELERQLREARQC